MTEEPESGGRLAPAMPLAVIDIAVSTSDASSADEFWGRELEFPVPDSHAGNRRDVLAGLVDRWGASRVGLAFCGAAEGPAIDRKRFSATWLGGAAASDALAALRWELEGFAEERFERALLGGRGSDGAEVWLVLAPLAAARTAGLRVLAIWSERPVAGAVRLVTSVHATQAEIAAGIALALREEHRGLPERTLWIRAAPEGADAQTVLAACAAAVLAVASRTLPRSNGIGAWHGPRERGFGQFARARPWLRDTGGTLRSSLALIPSERGLLAAGFTDADPDGPDPMKVPWPAQLVVLSAPSEATLRAEIEALRQRLAGTTADSIETIAAELWARPRHRHRCAVVATGTIDLARNLARASARLEGAAAHPSPRERVWMGACEHAGTPIAFVIPGQGSQYPGALRELTMVSAQTRGAFEQLAAVLDERGISLEPQLYPAGDVLGTDLGKELEGFWREVAGGGLVGSVVSQALQEFLSAYDVRPNMLIGHSIGETTALALAGALGPTPPGHMTALARSFGALRADLIRLSQTLDDAGIAVSNADSARIERALEAYAGRVFLALDNCPHQLVLLGEKAAISALSAELRAEGIACLDVWLGAPFHTPLLAGAIESMSAFYDRLGIRAPSTPVWSGAADAPFPAEPPGIKALLLQQWTETVRFSGSLRSLYERGVRIFVEVGPGDTLSGFIDDTLAGRDHLALACDSQWFGGIEHLLGTLGRLFVAGVEVAPSRNAKGRDFPRIRAAHDALLREAEASEARVRGALPARASTAPATVRSGASAFPALGARQNGPDGTVVFERRLTLESDLYLRDHVFGIVRSPQARDLSALPVVPMVMTLETLAEAGLAAGRRERRAVVVAAVERLRLHRWLTLDRGYLDMRVVARPQSGTDKVQVELFELDEAAPAGRWSAAEAIVVLAPGLASPPPGRRIGGEPIEPRWSPERYLKELIFQGPSLLCFRRLLRMTTEGIEAEVQVPPRDQLFRGDPAPALATAATLMDGAGQTVARWVAEYWRGWDGLYPFSADRYEQFGPLPEPGERLRCVALVKDEGHVAIADVEFQRPDGTVLFCYRDFRQRRFPMTAEVAACIRVYDADYAFTRSFDVGRDLRACVFDGAHHDILRPERAIFLQTIAHTVLTGRERVAWRAIPPGSPRRARWLMGRVAAKEAIRGWVSEHYGQSVSPVEIEIDADERGKPIARVIGGGTPPLQISISHADTKAVAAVAEEFSVGVDIEEERDGAPRTVPELAFADGELADAVRAGVSPIALWCAKEAAAKALGVGLLGEPRRWRVQGLTPNGGAAVVVIDALSVPVSLHARDGAVIAVARASNEDAADAHQTLRAAGLPEVKRGA